MDKSYDKFKKIVDDRFAYYADGHVERYSEFMKSRDYLDEIAARFKEAERQENEKYFESIAASCAYCLWQLA